MATDPRSFQFDVFLSHCTKDKAVVRDIAKRLKTDGVRVWLDEEQIKPGDSIPAKVEEGLARSRVLVLCISANASASDWAQLEGGTFRFRDPMNKERRFIPLRLDSTPIEGSLAQFLWINFQDNPAAAVQKIVETCKPSELSGLDKSAEQQRDSVPFSAPDDPWADYDLVCPCDAAHVREAMDIGRKHYGPQSISLEQFSEWMAGNGNVLVSLVNSDRDVVGYFDILPLRPEAFDAFLAGKIEEHDIHSDDILSPEEAVTARRLYLAGIAVRGDWCLARSRIGSVLIRNMFRFVQDFYPPNLGRELYAIAATDYGTRLLRRMEFEVVTAGERRKDKCDLYRYVITPKSLKPSLKRFNRMDGGCHVKWKKPPAPSLK